MKDVFVGTCGFPTSRSKYYSLFKVVELQETFYDLPTQERMSNLKREAPADFQFTVKVFQGLTHTSDSPTWRKIRRARLTGDSGNYGLLKPTRENFELWDEFVNVTKPLNPVFYVFQTPPSMEITEDSVRDVIEFFRTIGGSDRIGWEPRGISYNNVDLLRRVFEETGIVHVVDPFRHEVLVPRDVTYFRLHGIGKGEVNYSYKYTDNDLGRLKAIIDGVESSTIYVMFNNVHMLDDALRFMKLIGK
ncbi:DUF72 domain-containing protein [Vulcanisaeta distributa]|uniref:DUF72 domain-containing protein n=1 Tax=Vulcanisaeta distributa (strain DSM 14429 / JCM 11212 / NBRC 100878 / IC-017) TaxID=572478 RepID=E1QQA4_VULDI|nr:DUF72 domain-containing protein [Vulcanisaeta distributa]ADN51591.1 protein of unknown function DUF72 [Vulcanisaeta distributa DSM 14429]